jgi:hypothetical protein
MRTIFSAFHRDFVLLRTEIVNDQPADCQKQSEKRDLQRKNGQKCTILHTALCGIYFWSCAIKALHRAETLLVVRNLDSALCGKGFGHAQFGLCTVRRHFWSCAIKALHCAETLLRVRN